MSAAAIAGTRRAMKELVDGTIRVQIDIDRKVRRDFLEMFSDIDMPVALAPLTPTFERGAPQTAEGGVPGASSNGWANLGPLAQSAILVGREPDFQRYVAEMLGLDEHHHEAADEEQCADYIKEQCRVASRKDLDTADGARSRFGALMAHYREWERLPG